MTAQTLGLTNRRIKAAVNVSNLGLAPTNTNFRLAFYFSTDSTITTDDTFSGSYCDIAPLAGGGTSNCTVAVTVPAGLVPGTYYLGAILDDMNVLAEGNETNNSRAADSGAVTLVSTCILKMGLSLAPGNLTMNFALGETEPLQWTTWLITGFSAKQLWTRSLPVIDSPTAFSKSIPGIANGGTIAVFTELAAAGKGILCYDFKTINTSGAGPAAQELIEVLRRQGITVPIQP